MIRITESVLTAAISLGVFLALRYLRDGRVSALRILHGLTGASGLILLLVLLRGPSRGTTLGAGSFGIVAAALFAAALTLGPFIPILHRRAPRTAGLVIATHASLAITGFVLFLAWVSVG